LHVAHYNLCRVHETLRVTPAMALGVTDHIWLIAELIDAALSAPAALLRRPRRASPIAMAGFNENEGIAPESIGCRCGSATPACLYSSRCQMR
jgi:hypothetical protein